MTSYGYGIVLKDYSEAEWHHQVLNGGWFSNCSAGLGAFSDRGCLLFQVGLTPGGLPGWVCLGNVPNLVLSSTPGVHKGLLAARSLLFWKTFSGVFNWGLFLF